MRTTVDALLSMKRYTAMALGSDWEVRLWADVGEFRFPGALVLRVGDALTSGPKHWSDITQAFAIHCYPVMLATVEAALLQAHGVEETLVQAFDITGVGEGHKRRVPLYDWDGLDPAAQDSDTRYPHDYLRIVDFSTGLIPDAEEPRNIRVVADLRATWRRTGPLPTGALLEELRVSGTPLAGGAA